MEWSNLHKNMKETESKTLMDTALIPIIEPIDFAMDPTEKSSAILTLKPRKKSMTSLYLKFFENAPDGKSRRCKFCKQSYSMSTATGNLGRHLNHHHPGYDKQGDTSQVVTAHAVTNKKPQPHSKHTVVDFDLLNWLLVKWLIDSFLPPSTIEDELLNNSFKFLNPLFRLWSKKKVQAVTFEVFRSMREDVKVSLDQVNSKVSITLDFWTSCEQLFFMSIRCHWLDDNWLLHKVLLDVSRIPFPCSGAEIFYELTKILKMYNIERRILFCTHDNSQNAVHACHVLKEELDARKVYFYHIPCAAHTLNLIIEDCLRTPKIILNKVREFFIDLNSCPELTQEFNQMASAYPAGTWKFPLDTSVSWNGYYVMLDIVTKASNSMDTIVRNHEDTFGNRNVLLSTAEKSVVTTLHTYLEPFYKLTTNLCTCKVPTIGLVLFFMDHVFELINNCRESSRYEWFKSAADDMATRARNFCSQVYNLFTFIATILDPRIKKELIPESLNTDKNLEEARSLFARNYSLSSFPAIGNSFGPPEGEEVNGVSFVEEIARKRRRMTTYCSTDELTQYLAEPPVPLATDVLDWWRMNAARYPRLSIMARDYLSMQGIAVDPEDVFSMKGDEKRKRQFSLPYSSMQAIMCVESWSESGYKFKFQSSEIDFEKLMECAAVAQENSCTVPEKKQK